MNEMKPWMLGVILALAAVVTAVLVATGGGESPEEKRRRELDEKLDNIQRQLDDIERRNETLTAPPAYE